MDPKQERGRILKGIIASSAWACQSALPEEENSVTAASLKVMLTPEPGRKERLSPWGPHVGLDHTQIQAPAKGPILFWEDAEWNPN